MTYRVVVTETAARHLHQVLSWLSDNHPRGYRVFESELRKALHRLAIVPFSGAPYPHRPGTRRLLLRRSQYHLYYRVDSENERVEVRAVWATRRGARPELD